jgi:tRNA pseudouridine55 synthase
MDGILNLDKPASISSARAVARVKRLLPPRTKIGHAGTLDPFATGVLLLLVGRATKLCETMMDQPKQYQAVVKFGSTTATDDPESPEVCWPDLQTARTPTEEDIDKVLTNFKGKLMQIPPIFSALKVNGKRAYKLARGGQAPVMVARSVMVYSIDRLDYVWPLLKLRIDCGRGTYIRSLARDIGAALHVGGYLTQLRRTRVGQFTTESAASLESLTADSLPKQIIPINQITIP